jgi:hypothetical protein
MLLAPRRTDADCFGRLYWLRCHSGQIIAGQKISSANNRCKEDITYSISPEQYWAVLVQWTFSGKLAIAPVPRYSN